MKAQASVDFVIAVAVALIFFAILVYSAKMHLNTARELMLSMEGRRVSEKLASSMNDVLLAGDGSIGSVLLPGLLYGGRNYTISVYPHSILVSYEDGGRRDVSSKTLSYEINGSLAELKINPGLIQIKNVGDSIYLENI